MDFRKSKTYNNLMAAYAGESQARVKYELYAAKAKKEGFEQVGALFCETALNERAHAEKWLEYLHDGAIPTTAQNLEDARQGEHFEWSEMYREFAQVAKEEGYNKIAAHFELVAKVEEAHENRYNTLLANLNGQQIFKKVTSQRWICRNCGHIHEGTEAPTVCPLCGYPQAYFEVKADNY